MADPELTPRDQRLLSVGYILPAMGYAAWLVGVAGPIVAWLTGTPFHDRNTGQDENGLPLSMILFAVASALIGTLLVRMGSKIRRAYRDGRRSGI